MIDGIWSAQFYVPPSGAGVFGSGVVVFSNGSISGGDSTYYYRGNYKIINGKFSATVSIIHYSGPYNNVMGVGTKQTDITLTGDVDQHEFEVSGISPTLKSPIAVWLEFLSKI